MDFDTEIERLRRRIFPLSRFVLALSRTLEAPKFIELEAEACFRFEKPELIHFCLLRAVRIVSALSASIELARAGFSQEIGVLLRTMIEYSTQIDFMLASLDKEGKLAADAAAFVTSYFDDAHRPMPSEGKRAKLVQKKVHDIVGARLDATVGSPEQAKPATQLMSNVYLVFSNYVHGRYPESMDLYGGGPPHFHVNGMSRTPKDGENLEILETLITTASLCMMAMVFAFKLHPIFNSDPVLQNWFNQLSAANSKVS